LDVDPALPTAAAPKAARRRLVPVAAGILGLAAALVAAFMLREPGVAPVSDDPLDHLVEAPLPVDDSAEVTVDPEVLSPDVLAPDVLESPGREAEGTEPEGFDAETGQAADSLDAPTTPLGPSTPVERSEPRENSRLSPRATLASERPSAATPSREPAAPIARERTAPDPRASTPGTNGRRNAATADTVAARTSPDPSGEGSRERPAALPAVDPPAAGVPSSVGTAGVQSDAAALSSLPPPPAPAPSRPETTASAVVQPPAAAPAAVAPPAATPAAAVPQPQERSTDPRAEAERAVQQLLQQYVTAYNRLDASAARAIWPGVDSAALERAFSQLSEQRLRFERCSISVDEDAGSATCAGQARWIPRVGDRSGREERRTWKFELGRSGNDWIITRAEARR
jgi:hypothetical protein